VNDLVRFAGYLETQAGEYAERIKVKARVHTMPLRVESIAAVMAGLACLHEALTEDGEIGSLRTIANDCVNEILAAAEEPESPRIAESGS
jgi:hypothetical protein